MLDEAAMPQEGHTPPLLPCLIFECHSLLDDASAAKNATSATSSSGLGSSKPEQIRVFTFCPMMMMCRGGDVAGGGAANCSARQVKLVVVCHCSHTHESFFTYQAAPGSGPLSAADLDDVLKFRTAASDATARPEQQQHQQQKHQQQHESQDSDKSPANSGGCNSPANAATPQADIEKKYSTTAMSVTRDALSEESTLLIAAVSGGVQAKAPSPREPVRVEFESVDKDSFQFSNQEVSPPDTSTTTGTSGASNSSEKNAPPVSPEESSSHVAWGVVLLPEPLEDQALHSGDSTEAQGAVQQQFMVSSPLSTKDPVTLKDTAEDTPKNNLKNNRKPTLMDFLKNTRKDKPQTDWESLGGNEDSDMVTEPGSQQSDISESESCVRVAASTTTDADEMNRQDGCSSNDSQYGSPPAADRVKELESEINAAETGTGAQTKEKDATPAQPQQQAQKLTSQVESVQSQSSRGCGEDQPPAVYQQYPIRSENSDMVAKPGSQQSNLSASESSARDALPKVLSVDNSEPRQLAEPTTTAAPSATATNAKAAAVAADVAVEIDTDEMNRRGGCSSTDSLHGSPPAADRVKELESEINAAETGTGAQTKEEDASPAQPQQQQPQQPKQPQQQQTQQTQQQQPQPQQPQQQEPQPQTSQAESVQSKPKVGADSAQSKCSQGYCEDQPPAVYQQYPMSRIYEVNRVAANLPETGGWRGTSISVKKRISPSLRVMKSGFYGADIFKEPIEALDAASIVTNVDDADKLSCSGTVDQQEVAPPPPTRPLSPKKPLTTTAASGQESAKTPHSGHSAAAPSSGTAASDCGSTIDSMSARVGSLDMLSSSSTRSRLYDTALAELRRQHQQQHQHQQLQQHHDGCCESDHISETRTSITGSGRQIESVTVRAQSAGTTEVATAACTLQCRECCACYQVQSTVECCQQNFSPRLLAHKLASNATCCLCKIVACQPLGAQLPAVTCPPRVHRCPQPSVMSMATTCGSGSGWITQQQHQQQQQQQQQQQPTSSHVQRPNPHNRSNHRHRRQRQHPTTGGHNAATATGEATLNWQRLLMPDAVARLRGFYLGGGGGGGGYLSQVFSRDCSYAASGPRQHPMLHHNSSVCSELAALSAAAASPRVKSEAAVHLMVQPSETATVLAGNSETDTGSYCHLAAL